LSSYKHQAKCQYKVEAVTFGKPTHGFWALTPYLSRKDWSMTADTSSNGLPMPKIERTRPVMVGSPNNAVGAQDERSLNKKKLQRIHYGNSMQLPCLMPATFQQLTTMLIAASRTWNLHSLSKFDVMCSAAVLLAIPGNVCEQSQNHRSMQQWWLM
jgi:hypothetical protein